MKSNDTDKRLYIVATPIGNRADFTQRAIDCLRSVDLVLCENTEHSLRLLRHHAIEPRRLRKLTDHASEREIEGYLSQCAEGGIALISDAGTPQLCDPGHRLVQMAHADGFGVIAVPGPCALVAALSICPFSVVPFQFHGFAPRKASERVALFKKIQNKVETYVFYESPHRLSAFLHDAIAVFPVDREVFIVKELTKRFECFWHGALSDVQKKLSEKPIQGEFVVIISGQSAEQRQKTAARVTIDLDACIQSMQNQGLSTQTIMSVLETLANLRKNDLYKRILSCGSTH